MSSFNFNNESSLNLNLKITLKFHEWQNSQVYLQFSLYPALTIVLRIKNVYSIQQENEIGGK
jgi:hypothetical protein